MYRWKKGISLSFFQNEKGESIGADQEILQMVRDFGFDSVELSFSHDDYFTKYHLTEGNSAEELYDFCHKIGLDIWSIHLPFSDQWDLSKDDAKEALQDDIKLIEAASRAHVSVAVIHPSFEPIAASDRAKRLDNAKKNLEILNREASNYGIILALENLPRTCLGNTSVEMLELLRETGASFIFDTNHSLGEDNVHFLQTMIQNSYCPVSLHISDYDFIDERHDLPGCGINKWRVLLDMLQEASYQGPALYEIRHAVSPIRIVSFEELTENIGKLLAGDIE
jgi:sugar phosphate isomerase/epimerase